MALQSNLERPSRTLRAHIGLIASSYLSFKRFFSSAEIEAFVPVDTALQASNALDSLYSCFQSSASTGHRITRLEVPHMTTLKLAGPTAQSVLRINVAALIPQIYLGLLVLNGVVIRISYD